MRRPKRLTYLPSNQIILSVVLILLASSLALAQINTDATQTSSQNDIQRRIDRARALAASHQLEMAAKELESVRASTVDDVVQHVTAVILIGIYVEAANYPRAENLLDQTFRAHAARKEGLPRYFALAGQALNSARLHLQRYRTFGINIADAALPEEALQDLNRLKSLIERMVVQAKVLTGNDPRAYDALSLLEDLSSIRLSLARDSEDRAKWEKEHLAARDGLASSHTQIASISGIPQISTLRTPNQASGTVPQDSVTMQDPKEEPRTFNTGSLNQRATKKVVPVYPALAKSGGLSGLVRVFVIIDETGNVLAISRFEGPQVFKQAAEEAARGWQFEPTIVDDKAVRLSGYIEFNFTL